MIDESSVRNFQSTVWDYYGAHSRDLPWRQAEPNGSFDPYKILVSEVMLQQTQVPRVIPKYREFLLRFPTLESLAAAQQGDVLRSWSGLGYNRRAKFLYQAAQRITTDYDGEFPVDATELVKLPGIGQNTAAAILAYTFNRPVVFIETNIRTVFIHFFFNDQSGIKDAEITALADQTLDADNPREWYWALMDYGTHLKQTVGNLNKQSRSYAKQSTFHGSRRQIRGQVLKLLATENMTLNMLSDNIKDDRLPGIVGGL